MRTSQSTPPLVKRASPALLSKCFHLSRPKCAAARARASHGATCSPACGPEPHGPDSDTANIRSAPSAPPLARRAGPAQDTASALSVCAASVCSGTSARRSHSLTVRSNDAVARWCGEAGCHAAAVTQSVCDVNARLACAPVASVVVNYQLARHARTAGSCDLGECAERTTALPAYPWGFPGACNAGGVP